MKVLELVGKQVKVSTKSKEGNGWFLSSISNIVINEDFVRISGCMFTKKLSHCLFKELVENGVCEIFNDPYDKCDIKFEIV